MDKDLYGEGIIFNLVVFMEMSGRIWLRNRSIGVINNIFRLIIGLFISMCFHAMTCTSLHCLKISSICSLQSKSLLTSCFAFTIYNAYGIFLTNHLFILIKIANNFNFILYSYNINITYNPPINFNLQTIFTKFIWSVLMNCFDDCYLL